MHKKLSIIIPCFNCEKTLDDAVTSCFKQGLKSNEFEIVMVDDSSTDGTASLMQRLATEHHEIKIFFHEKNRGGGATRNTAVANSLADIIFCLDSDDILPPNTLSKMLAYLNEKKCDGIVFAGSVSFKKSIEKGRFNDFKIPNKPIALSDVFSGNAWGVGANFLYKKESYKKSKGYPEYHNLDTQGFGVRFLKENNTALVCPDSFFYQRQFTKRFSYFERSYNNGELSTGNYFILREIFYTLTKKAQDEILNYNIFQSNRLGVGIDNIYNFAVKLHREGLLFDINQKTENELTLATDNFIENKYKDAIDNVIKYINGGGIMTNNLLYEIILYTESLAGKVRLSEIIDDIRAINTNKITSNEKRKNILMRIIHKII
jgi:glycosyltransferase involved in cell wall biosynthesis